MLARLFPKYERNCKNKLSNNLNAYIKHMHEIDTKKLSFPLLISDIGKVEKWNNLSINVFTPTSSDDIVPLRISDQQDRVPVERIIYLHYISSGEESYYCLITNLASLCRS